MPHIVSSSENTQSSADRVTIVARLPDGWSTSHELWAGESVLIGTDEQCRFRLPDGLLSPKHCLVRFVDGELEIQDWCSDTGTIVDGRPVDGIVNLMAKADVEIGPYALQFVLQTEQDGEELALLEDALPEHAEDHGETPSIDISDGVSCLGSHFNIPHEADIEDAESWEDTQSVTSIDQETLEILRAEVELLQSELAERDSQLAELSDGCTRSEQQADIAPNESKALEQRVQTLLEELEHGDERVSDLEHALRLSEEATLAEMEERRQIDAWVRDIEDRIGQREAEWKAEQQVLNQRLLHIVEERDRFRHRVHQVADVDRVEPALKEMLTALQSTNSMLESRIASEELRNDTLTKRCRKFEEKAAAGYQQHQVDDAVRAERLQLAQERAELSRLRAELTSKLQEAHRDSHQDERLSSADQKFLAFRKHLREIHEEEKVEHIGSTLPERLVKLWRRLDGPTDID